MLSVKRVVVIDDLTAAMGLLVFCCSRIGVVFLPLDLTMHVIVTLLSRVPKQEERTSKAGLQEEVAKTNQVGFSGL